MATTHYNIGPLQSSGLTGGHPNLQPNPMTGLSNPRHQGPHHGGPGPYCTSQDYQPGASACSHPQTQIPPRPVYAHAVPPFLQYQWPMPFPYYPYTGFPAVGYGMVPPFPPNPYMEAPCYMLPQHHLQPVDYRRMLHPQFPAAGVPYPGQNRRFRPQHSYPVVRETVNCEVQTEPTQIQGEAIYVDASPLLGSESGRGTSSSTPSPLVTRKQGCTEVENLSSADGNTKDDLQVGKMGTRSGTDKPSSETLCMRLKTAKSQIKAPLEAQKGHKVNVGLKKTPCRHGSLGHCDQWSMCSMDAIVPVCSSSDREDEMVVKEKQVSFPDIMSWAGALPPVVMPELKEKCQKESKQLSNEETEIDYEKTMNCSAIEMTSSQAAGCDDADHVFIHKTETRSKILRLPINFQLHSNEVVDAADLVDSIVAGIHSRNGMAQNPLVGSPGQPETVPENERENGNETTLNEEATAVTQEMSFSLFQSRKKINESIWSIESLLPYIPSNEWLKQNGISEPDVIIEEILESAQKGHLYAQNGEPVAQHNEGRLSCRFSLPAESLPVYLPLASCLTDQHNLNCYSRFPSTSQQDVSVGSPVDKQSSKKKLSMNCQIHPSKEELKSDNMDPSDLLTSPAFPEKHVEDGTKKIVEDGSSKFEANPGPNQEYLGGTEQQVKSPSSSEGGEPHPSNSLEEEGNTTIIEESSPCIMEIEPEPLKCGHEFNGKPTSEQQVEYEGQKVAPKGHVDCGVQCSELQECNCPCKGSNKCGDNKTTSKYSDPGRVNKARTGEEDCENRHRNSKKHGQWKNRHQDRHQSNKLFAQRKHFKDGQEEPYNGYNGRPGKTSGGNGRPPRY